MPLLPDGLTPLQLALVALAAFIAGLARGFSGFGAALIFMPIASALVGPRLAAPLLLIIDAATTVGLVPDAVRRADRREVAVMALGAIVGIPAGAWVLTHMEPLALRWTIVVIVAALFGLLASGWRYRGRPRPPLTIAVGAVSGLFSGASQLGGPPIIAYWLGGAIPADRVRANIVLYFEISTLLSALSFYIGGLFVAPLLPLSLATGPLYGAGLFAGSRLFGKASEGVFRRICLLLIAFAALGGMPLFDGILRG